MAEWLYLKNDVILGDEYSHLIQNYRQYCQKYNFQIYANVPKFIYLAPKSKIPSAKHLRWNYFLFERK